MAYPGANFGRAIDEGQHGCTGMFRAGEESDTRPPVTNSLACVCVQVWGCAGVRECGVDVGVCGALPKLVLRVTKQVYVSQCGKV